MKKTAALWLAVLCLALGGCAARPTTSPAPCAGPDAAPTATPGAPAPTPVCTIPVDGVTGLQYDLYRDCLPAEDVFAVEKLDLPSAVDGRPLTPLGVLDDGALLVYLYRTNAGGTLPDRDIAAVGRYDPDTGDCDTLFSAPDRYVPLVLTWSGDLIVYQETPYSGDLPAAGQIVRLCCYDRRDGQTHKIFDYPDDFIGSAAFYRSSALLTDDALYFDTSVSEGGAATSRVCQADLTTLDVSI